MAVKKACFVDYIALILLIVGGINWGLVGAIEKDLIQDILKLDYSIARIIYVLVGLAGLWGLFVTLGRLKK
ncbi:MAG: DUF378 domain-containing protein [Candidatus Fermentibacteraceae bacterium]